MHRIDTTGAVASLPTPATVGSTVGFFSEGNPALGDPATILSADWANALQEEVCKVIETAGLTLDKTKRDQLLTALKALGTNLQVFTASGTFVVPANVTKAFVEVWGAGGGGSSVSGGSGGAGSYAMKLCTVTPGQSIAVTVGAGGAAAANAAAAGNGGASSFGAFCTANGGTGASANGGSGGSASGGDLNLPGQNGGDIGGSPNFDMIPGGAAPFGGAGGLGHEAGNNGGFGQVPGGGGGANNVGNAGGGASGLVIVRW